MEKQLEEEKVNEMLEYEKIKKDVEKYLAEERCKEEKRIQDAIDHNKELMRHEQNGNHMRQIYQTQIEVDAIRIF